jgi:hypothetical protein
MSIDSGKKTAAIVQQQEVYGCLYSSLSGFKGKTTKKMIKKVWKITITKSITTIFVLILCRFLPLISPRNIANSYWSRNWFLAVLFNCGVQAVWPGSGRISYYNYPPLQQNWNCLKLQTFYIITPAQNQFLMLTDIKSYTAEFEKTPAWNPWRKTIDWHFLCSSGPPPLPPDLNEPFFCSFI